MPESLMHTMMEDKWEFVLVHIPVSRMCLWPDLSTPLGIHL